MVDLRVLECSQGFEECFFVVFFFFLHAMIEAREA